MADSESANWTATIFNWLGFGRYSATPPTLTDQQTSAIAVDANANLQTVDVYSRPARTAVAVTKSDATVYSPPLRALYVGTTGDVAVVLADDSAPVTLTSIPAGSILPIQVKQVKSTGTSAGGFVGFR